MEDLTHSQPGYVRPLSAVQAGTTVRIQAVKAGRGLARRLAAMGLLPDVEVTVLRHQPGGPTMISARGTKVILGRGVADKVMVY